MHAAEVSLNVTLYLKFFVYKNRLFVLVQERSDHIASKIKHAVKLKTSPARLAQLLHPSLAFCISLQPMTAHRAVRRHWLQAKTILLMRAATVVQVLHLDLL